MIVDTHTHIYDPSRPQGVPWPPEDDVVYRTTLPDRVIAQLDAAGVQATIVVEASVWQQDNQWVLDQAKDQPRIWGFVGNLAADSPDFQTDLRRLAENPLFRGIRLRPPPAPLTADHAAMRALRALSELDLSVDLPARPETLADIAQVAGQLPGLRIVLNHVAHVRIDGRSPDPAWQAGLRRLAPHANVYCKVSGLVENATIKPAPRDPDFYRPTLEALAETLGPQRLVYASNWPVCERTSDYATTLEVVRAYFSHKGTQALQAVLCDAGQAAYRWAPR